MKEWSRKCRPSTQLTTSAIAGGIAASFADPVSPLSTPDQGTGTAVLERPETEEQTDRSDNGDADRFAHYVSTRSSPNQLTGRPVVALCGKIWVPKHDRLSPASARLQAHL